MYAAAYVWAKVIGYLEQRLTDVTVSAWLDDAEVVSLTQDCLTVYSPSDFRRDVIREQCAPHIHDALAQLNLADVKLEVWGDHELRRFREEKRADSAIPFNPQFSFGSFVIGPTNEMAVKIAQAAAQSPGNPIYNPLFIYGPPGVGKTHLLYAIANEVLRQQPQKRVICIRGDQFTNELVSAIRTGKTAEFKQKYRQVDVFLVDDIQFIAGKESTQEEFFHTFNDLYEHKKQIVLTADRRPNDMVTLEERLRGRFGAGIMVGIEAPEYETRLRIVKAKAAELSLELQEPVAAYIAQALSDNARQIDGAMKKLRAYRDLNDMELSLENVQRTIEDIHTAAAMTTVTPAAVIRNVCRYYGLDEQTIKGVGRAKAVVLPRQIAMYLLRRLTGLSFPNIARLFERDNATVQHAVKKVEEALARKEGNLEGVVQDIIANIEAGAV